MKKGNVFIVGRYYKISSGHDVDLPDVDIVALPGMRVVQDHEHIVLEIIQVGVAVRRNDGFDRQGMDLVFAFQEFYIVVGRLAYIDPGDIFDHGNSAHNESAYKIL
jgi:hypothetical protein